MNATTVQDPKEVFLPAIEKTNQPLNKSATERFHAMFLDKMEIEIFLNEKLPDVSKDAVKQLAEKISDLSIIMMFNPGKFQDQGHREPSIKRKSIPAFWMHLSPDSSTLRIQFYGKLLGEGSYKYVFKSRTMIIELKPASPKPKQMIDTVLYRTKDSVLPSDREGASQEQVGKWTDDDLAKMKASLGIMNELLAKDKFSKDPNIKIVGTATVIRDYVGKHRKKLEWEGPRLPADAYQVAKKGKIPQDITWNEDIPLDVGHICDLIDSVCHTLDAMHKESIVHGDTRAKNILVEWDSIKRRAYGHVTDLDFLRKIGDMTEPTPCNYWSLLSVKGYNLPTADIFGAAISLGELALKHDFSMNMRKRFEKDVFLSNKERTQLYDKVQAATNSIIDALTVIGNKSGIAAELISALKMLKYQSRRLTVIKSVRKAFGQACDFHPEIKALCDKEYHDLSLFKRLIKFKRDKISILFFEKNSDVPAMKEITRLILDVIEQDTRLYCFLRRHPDVQKDKNKLFDPHVPLHEKQQIMEKLYVKFPIYKSFRERLQKIKDKWIQTYH